MFLLPSSEVQAAISLQRELLGLSAAPKAGEFYRMLETARAFATAANTTLKLWSAAHMAVEPFTPKLHPLAPPPFHVMDHFRRQAVAGMNVATFMTEPRNKKPPWNIDHTIIDSAAVGVTIEEAGVPTVNELDRKAARLIHFKRDTERKDPPVLLFAPLSGHYSTLLRDTVRALLPDHDVYVVDWNNARDTPGLGSHFGVDEYISLAMKYIDHFKGDIHVAGVCQPGPELLAAVSLMHQINKKAGKQVLHPPRSLTLKASPIDTDQSPQAPNIFARSQPIEWFKENVVCQVPPRFGYAGEGEWVYPGGLQGFAFMAMKPDWHHGNMRKRYERLMAGDVKGAMERHDFYEEYLTFLDLPAKFYLETVERIFQKNQLGRGTMKWSGTIAGERFENLLIEPAAITRTALATFEGRRDDITGIGQCSAAHGLCSSLMPWQRLHHIVKSAGHYSVFNGYLYQKEVLPLFAGFIRKIDATFNPDSKYTPHRNWPGQSKRLEGDRLIA